MESQENVWDNIATEWNQYRKDKIPEIEEFLEGKKGKILDIGCGSGRNMISKDLEWVGLDFSKKMLECAKKNTQDNKIKAEFIHSKTNKLNFPKATFDYVICYAVLHCVKDKERGETIKEIFRVLKNQGKAIISVWGRSSPVLKSKQKESFIKWKNSENLRYTYIYEPEELEKQLLDAGFKIIDKTINRNITFIVEKPISQS
jgi:ubiquinone/menaquinone biosynthesis C-methylase UbiE